MKKFLIIFIAAIFFLPQTVEAGCCSDSDGSCILPSRPGGSENNSRELCEGGLGSDIPSTKVFYPNFTCAPTAEDPNKGKCLAPGELPTRAPKEPQAPITFTPSVGIPGSEFQPGEKIYLTEQQGEKEYAVGIGKYIAAAFKFVVGIVGFLAVVMIMWAGFQWLTAAGNPEKISHARETMINAVIGVMLALGSYTILQIINPRLTEFQGIPVPYVQPIASDEEDFPSCRAFENDPAAERCVMEHLEDIGGGFYLQKNAAADLRLVFQEFTGATLSVNSTFRNSQRQACLQQTLRGANGQLIANAPCTSDHEKALAVDLKVSELTTEQFKKLIDIAKAHKFKNDQWDSGDLVPPNWQEIDERWHFSYTGAPNESSLTALCPGKADPPSNCH